MPHSSLPLPIEDDLEALRTELQCVSDGVCAQARFVELGSRSTVLCTAIATALTAAPADGGARASSPARTAEARQLPSPAPRPRLEEDLEHLRTELQRILDRLDTRPHFFALRPGVTALRDDIAVALGIRSAVPRRAITPKKPMR